MYFTIYGQCESIDDASYVRSTTEDDGTITNETIAQVQITLAIPGMRDLVKATFAATDIKTQPAWEDKMLMLKVIADKYTLSTGVRGKKAWGLVSYHGIICELATDDEQSRLSNERKRVKAQQKKKREELKASKVA